MESVKVPLNPIKLLFNSQNSPFLVFGVLGSEVADARRLRCYPAIRTFSTCCRSALDRFASFQTMEISPKVEVGALGDGSRHFIPIWQGDPYICPSYLGHLGTVWMVGRKKTLKTRGVSWIVAQILTWTWWALQPLLGRSTMASGMGAEWRKLASGNPRQVNWPKLDRRKAETRWN